MNALIDFTRNYANTFLRIALGIVLFWIGALKFADPSPVVGLLSASFPFLASNGFVYLLGTVEVAVAVMLFSRYALRYAGLILMGLFTGTIVIFLIAPQVSYGEAGFPFLSLVGEFLLKDLVLFSASMVLVAAETAKSTVTKEAMVN